MTPRETMSPWPKISIVTPSHSQAAFVEMTLPSGVDPAPGRFGQPARAVRHAATAARWRNETIYVA